MRVFARVDLLGGGVLVLGTVYPWRLTTLLILGSCSAPDQLGYYGRYNGQSECLGADLVRCYQCAAVQSW